ncbi:hypothetical protein KA405_06350 [Patescibacteria group bacterium]|nr:hypothetical protein [Patescibacteria group bacterium]
MRGQHVYKCNSKDDIVSAIESIFTQDNMYDYVILAQEYIEIQREYRVIVYNNKVQIVYYKNVENAIFQ